MIDQFFAARRDSGKQVGGGVNMFSFAHAIRVSVDAADDALQIGQLGFGIYFDAHHDDKADENIQKYVCSPRGRGGRGCGRG